MFFILEVQGYEDGTFAHILTQKADQNEAEADYYRVLSAAAISDIPVHGATLLDEQMRQRMYKSYDRRSKA